MGTPREPTVVQSQPEGGLAGEPTVLSAGQPKAFERVPHACLAEAVRRRGFFSGWLRWAALALAAGWVARGLACGRLGPRCTPGGVLQPMG